MNMFLYDKILIHNKQIVNFKDPVHFCLIVVHPKLEFGMDLCKCFQFLKNALICLPYNSVIRVLMQFSLNIQNINISKAH